MSKTEEDTRPDELEYWQSWGDTLSDTEARDLKNQKRLAWVVLLGAAVALFVGLAMSGKTYVAGTPSASWEPGTATAGAPPAQKLTGRFVAAYHAEYPGDDLHTPAVLSEVLDQWCQYAYHGGTVDGNFTYMEGLKFNRGECYWIYNNYWDYCDARWGKR